MKISIDFDDTYTKDPKLWDMFAITAMAREHDVYCVSFRYETQMDKVKESIGKIIGPNKCIGTNHKPKDEFMKQNHNICIDVWIDDLPELIKDSILILGTSMPYSP